jgi:hypothetical protein
MLGGVLIISVHRSSCLAPQICLAFFSVAIKKGWLSDSEEKIYWERWQFPIKIAKGYGAR